MTKMTHHFLETTRSDLQSTFPFSKLHCKLGEVSRPSTHKAAQEYALKHLRLALMHFCSLVRPQEREMRSRAFKSAPSLYR